MANVEIGSSTAASTLRLNTQKKIIRDSSGYYYACWHNQDDEIFLVKSASTSGFSGAETPVEIVGDSGVALADIGVYPDIVIDGNDILHMVFRQNTDKEAWYVQWDTSTDMTNSNNWKHADGSTVGAERLCTDNFGNINTPAIDTDSNNYPHVAWDQDDGGTYETFYRYWTGSAWSSADDQITDASAQDCRNPAIAIDGNDDIHVLWRYYEADISIRYGHSHDSANWYQSDDTTPITDGASGEEILDQAAKDMQYAQITISKYAGTLNDIWVVVEEATDDDIMYAWYDKSGGSWTVDQDLETDGVCHDPTVSIDDSGDIYVMYDKDGDIRLAHSLNSGSSWTKANMVTSVSTLVQAHIEKNFEQSGYFGYIFFDSTNGKIYFNRNKWYRKRYPFCEQNQPACLEDLGYVFQDNDEDRGYWDKITQATTFNPLKQAMVEQKGTNKLGYVYTKICEDQQYFDKIERKGKSGGASLIWLKIP